MLIYAPRNISNSCATTIQNEIFDGNTERPNVESVICSLVKDNQIRNKADLFRIIAEKTGYEVYEVEDYFSTLEELGYIDELLGSIPHIVIQNEVFDGNTERSNVESVICSLVKDNQIRNKADLFRIIAEKTGYEVYEVEDYFSTLEELGYIDELLGNIPRITIQEKEKSLKTGSAIGNTRTAQIQTLKTESINKEIPYHYFHDGGGSGSNDSPYHYSCGGGGDDSPYHYSYDGEGGGNSSDRCSYGSHLPNFTGLTQLDKGNNKDYIVICTAIGLFLGLSIAYLAGAAALTPVVAAIAVFVAAAAVGALVGYGTGKFCEKVSSKLSDTSTKHSELGQQM